MRVIAGRHKGVKLNDFNLASTKPTLDRVKEAIFSIIQTKLDGAVVLDLFAGTGALGIEAVSRGADKVTFVDNNKDAIKICKQNLEKINEKASVFYSDALKFLKEQSLLNEKYDIILIDAPFDTNSGEQAVELIVENELLNIGGVIVFERKNTDKFNFENAGYMVKCKHYGIVEVVIIEKI